MGQWHISIRGAGVHHNPKLPSDANKLAAGFVKVLKEHGHSITAAAFTSGSEEDLQRAPSGETPLEVSVSPDDLNAAS